MSSARTTATARRSAPSFRTLQQLIADETYGAFGHGHIDFYIPIDFGGGFRDQMEYPLLVDMAIHHFDLIRAVTGRNIERVFATSFNPSWSWFDHPPAAKLILELAGGLPFSYSGDWSANGQITPWNGHWRLQCAEGSVHLVDDKITVGECIRWGKDEVLRKIPALDIPHPEMHGTLHAFAEAIRTGTPAETCGADNLFSFGAVAAAIRSAQEERWVTVEEILRPA